MRRAIAILLVLSLASLPAAPARADALPTLLVWSEGPGAQELARSLGDAARACGRFELLGSRDLVRTLPAALRQRFATGHYDLRDAEEAEAVRRAGQADVLLVVGPLPEEPGSRSYRVRLFERSRGLVLTRRVPSSLQAEVFWDGVEPPRRPRGTPPGPRCGAGADRPSCGPAWYWAAAGVVVLGVLLAGFAAQAQNDGGSARFPR